MDTKVAEDNEEYLCVDGKNLYAESGTAYRPCYGGWHQRQMHQSASTTTQNPLESLSASSSAILSTIVSCRKRIIDGQYKG